MATPTRTRGKPGRKAASSRAPAGAGTARTRVPRTVALPSDLDQALRDDPAARAAYLAMPPSHVRAYVEFVDEAKRPETRVRRVQQALRMMAQWGAERAKPAARRNSKRR